MSAFLLQTLLPTILDMLLTAAVPVLVKLYYDYTKQTTTVAMQKDARERLHSALKTGALIALDTTVSDEQRIKNIIAYAKRSVPQAIDLLDPALDVLQDLAKAKLNETVQKL